jgi:hypothetical protein
LTNMDIPSPSLRSFHKAQDTIFEPIVKKLANVC